MSHSRRLSLQPAIESLTGRFHDSLSSQHENVAVNKPDFKELHLGSPVSPLRTRGPTAAANTSGPTTSSSSSNSSGGSVTGKSLVATSQMPTRAENGSGSRSHSGELSVLSGTIPAVPGSGSADRNLKPGHRRSASTGTPLIYSGSSFSTVAAGCKSHGSGATSSASSSPSVLPSGNICPSGKILKTGMAARVSNRSDTLCKGSGSYGHGSIVRGGGGGNLKAISNGRIGNGDAEETKRAGNEMYKSGKFLEALAMYDRAISLSPENAACRSNRAAALMALGRLRDAVRECEEAVRLDPFYARAHQRLASLYLRLGDTKQARHHLFYSGQCTDHAELQRLQTLEKHLNQCAEARKLGDWKMTVREANAALATGSDSSPQLVACKAEALLRVHRVEEADSCLANMPKLDSRPQTAQKIFGMILEAYVLYVQAQVDMAMGRFENAAKKVEEAAKIDHNNSEISVILNTVNMVVRAWAHGNELFSSRKYSEACTTYGEGLKYNTFNSVLYCNRAACWFKLDLWEKSVEDCNQALEIRPNYAKARLRRAASYKKLGRWESAVKDYELLRKELPGDNEIAESLNQAKAGLSKSREAKSAEYNSEVEVVSSLDKLRAALSLPGVSVIHFKAASDERCEELSPFVNTLCVRYNSVRFFKVDIEESLAVGKAERISEVPTFKIYKDGEKVKEMVSPSHRTLEDSIRYFIL